MAWPCNSVDPEEQYRRLERLLAELYLVLRALLAQGAPLLPPTHNQPPPQPPPPQDPSGSGRRRSRGGRSGCSQRPDGGSNHQNEPDDNSGGSCGGGGQQQQRKCAFACRLGHQDANWDAIGRSLKNIADGLKMHRQSIPSSGVSLMEKFFNLDPLLQFCENEKIAERNKPPILIT